MSRGQFVDDAILDQQPLLQAIRAIKAGVKKNKFGKFILYEQMDMNPTNFFEAARGIRTKAH